LLGLLFLADAMLPAKPSGPQFATHSEGLTRAEPKQKPAKRAEPVEAQQAPRARAPSLLQVDAEKMEPAQDETVRYELPPPTIAAPAQVIASAVIAPAPVVALAPAPRTAFEATAPAPVTPVDPAASAAMAAVEGKADASKIAASKLEPTNNQTPKIEAQRIKTAKVDAVKAEAAILEAVKPTASKIETIMTQSTAAPAPAALPASVPASPISQSIPPAPASAVTVVASTPPVVTEAPKVERVKIEPVRTTRHRKSAARPHDNGSRYAAFREAHFGRGTVPHTENGYAYGVSPATARAERLEMRGWSGEFGQSRYRF
jgi:hypothetical protein